MKRATVTSELVRARARSRAKRRDIARTGEYEAALSRRPPEDGHKSEDHDVETRANAVGFARRLVEDPKYRKRFRKRLLKGKLPPELEAMVWALAYGERAWLPRIGPSHILGELTLARGEFESPLRDDAENVEVAVAASHGARELQ